MESWGGSQLAVNQRGYRIAFTGRGDDGAWFSSYSIVCSERSLWLVCAWDRYK